MPTDPLQCPRPGCRPFEVVLYNQEVRSLLKQNQHHNHFSDSWADPQRHVVEARDLADARKRVTKIYPPEKGFVIAGVSQLGRG